MENILPNVITKARTLQKEGLLNQSEVRQLRSLVGQILWAANQTRPDISFDACMLAAKLKNARVQDILDANKVVKKVKSETVKLKFQHLGTTKNIRLGVFSDASLANLPDGGSQGGNIICLLGENGKASPVSWQSKKIRRIVRSTLTGEALAMSDAVDAAVFLAGLYSELMFNSMSPGLLPIVCITDSYSLLDALKSTKMVSEKRLRIELSNIKQMVDRGQIKSVTWTETKKQLADCLTKRGSSSFASLKFLETGLIEF